MDVINLGKRRELMVDDAFLLDTDRAQFVAHSLTPREPVLKLNRPCDGESMSYPVVFYDPYIERYRMNKSIRRSFL